LDVNDWKRRVWSLAAPATEGGTQRLLRSHRQGWKIGSKNYVLRFL